MPDSLIWGMDVPESCEECVIKHKFFRELKCADLPGMRNFGENRLYTGNRNPHCPISKLPPHGDLIDLDARVDAQFYDEMYEEWSIRTVTIRDLLNSIVEEMPPVIIHSNKEDVD